MVLRQIGKSNEERIENVKTSVDKAKEAVQLDIKDGVSWCEYLYQIGYSSLTGWILNLWIKGLQVESQKLGSKTGFVLVLEILESPGK